MSFEGYFQIICEQGHLHTEDCYYFDLGDWTCPDCDSGARWENLVDITNGSYCTCDEPGFCDCCDENGRVDGYVELEKETEGTWMKCDLGFLHAMTQPTYKVPKEGIGAICIKEREDGVVDGGDYSIAKMDGEEK